MYLLYSKVILLTFFSILSSFELLQATDYFVSPSGDDTSGDGTIGKPWKTFVYAMDRIYPGDVLYLRAGEYHEQLLSVRDGTPSAYITIASYNDEDAIIDGTGVITGNNGCLLSHSFMKFRGFTVRNWRDDGMAFYGCQFVELKNIKITAVTGGISMKGTVHDFVLDSCVIYDYYGGAGGYGFDATPEGTNDKIYNGVIKNCKAYLTTGAFDNCDGFALGHDGVSDITFSNCEVSGVGDGFDISGSKILLERCMARNSSYGGGYKLWRDNVTMVNCVGYDNAANVELDFDGTANKGVQARLINCTFYSCWTTNVWIENSTGGSTLEMYNCILGGGENTGLSFDGDNLGCYKGDYNLFHMNAPDRAVATSQLDFSLTQIQNGEWTVASGQDAHSKVVFDASTLFKDTVKTKPDLHLIKGALAIDNGSVVSGTPSVDFDNKSRNDGIIDIGAYEFSTGSGIDDPDTELTHDGFHLAQSFPNPLTSLSQVATIQYLLPRRSFVRLVLVDQLGHEILEIVNEMKEGGLHQTRFNPSFLAKGMYHYVLSSNNVMKSKKLVIVR